MNYAPLIAGIFIAVVLANLAIWYYLDQKQWATEARRRFTYLDEAFRALPAPPVILDRTGGAIVQLLRDGSLLVTKPRTTPRHCARRTPNEAE